MRLVKAQQKTILHEMDNRKSLVCLIANVGSAAKHTESTRVVPKKRDTSLRKDVLLKYDNRV